MSSNAESILNNVLEGKRAEIAPEMDASEYFEIFSAEQALKDYELSYEEIESGIVDGEHDGGVDSFYTILNGDVVDEEVSFSVPKNTSEINIIIIQSKYGNGFSESALDKLISLTRNLLDLSKNIENIDQYNDAIKSRVEIFRSTYRKLASRFPKLKITYIYAARRSQSVIHKNLYAKADELKNAASELFDEAEVNVHFWGARELVALARKRPNQVFELKFDQICNGDSGYIALVKLSEFYRFLCGGGKSVRSDLFESNVRDYQGSTEVNQEISATLNGDRSCDFWWFNNGVTILASRATSSGSLITIENPQIVNGLQTSSEIGAYFDEGVLEDHRTVMVKVVASEDEEIRDKIIKATNNQNMVPLASLRATDKVQRDIEHILKIHGYFYDRRKNFYKNEGKPANKIISINLLAQAMMTLLRGEPDNARARPSSLIKNDEVYRSIFSDDHDLDSYVAAAELIRRIEILLKTQEFSAKDRNNLRFYVLYWLVARRSRSVSLSPATVANLKGVVTSDEIVLAISNVNSLFLEHGGTDAVAKGPAFKGVIKNKIKELIVTEDTFGLLC